LQTVDAFDWFRFAETSTWLLLFIFSLDISIFECHLRFHLGISHFTDQWKRRWRCLVTK
jgi:hypothetical protein